MNGLDINSGDAAVRRDWNGPLEHARGAQRNHCTDYQDETDQRGLKQIRYRVNDRRDWRARD
jgi:hypothetical protein